MCPGICDISNNWDLEKADYSNYDEFGVSIDEILKPGYYFVNMFPVNIPDLPCIEEDMEQDSNPIILSYYPSPTYYPSPNQGNNVECDEIVQEDSVQYVEPITEEDLSLLNEIANSPNSNENKKLLSTMNQDNLSDGLVGLSFYNSMSNLEIDYNTDWATIYRKVVEYYDELGKIMSIFAVTMTLGNLLIRLRKKGYPTATIVRVIVRRKFWNTIELSEKLNISPEEAKLLLKGFGYKWDRHRLQYSRSCRSKKSRRRTRDYKHYKQ